MKKGSSVPIVEEPDEVVGGSLFSADNFFGGIFGDITNFQEKMKGVGGFTQVRSFSTYREYDNGKLVRDDSKGYEVVSDNGKGFMRVIKGGSDGLVEERREFGGDLRRIK